MNEASLPNQYPWADNQHNQDTPNSIHLSFHHQKCGLAGVMRNIILMLTFVNSNAIAEWVAVNHNQYAVGYANPATIFKDGNIARMWSLVDCKAITYFAGGPPFMSIKSQEEFDCKKKKLRTLVYTLHSEKMGEGEEIFIDSNPSKWGAVLPGSQIEDFLKIACGKE